MAKGRKKTQAASAVAASKRGLTRRVVLAGAAAAGVGATLLGGATYVRWWDRPPGAGLRALSQKEHDLVQAVAEAWMPAGDEPPTLSGADAQCGAFMDEVCARMPADQRKLLKLMLQIMDDTPRMVDLAPYTALPLEDRARHLKVWLESPVFLHRQGVSAVMALISMAYTSHPEVAPVFSRWFGCGYGR